MSNAELIYEEVKTLPENRVAQVLDFVKHIKQEEATQDESTNNDCIYGEDCPLHAENPPFNAKVLAAIAEGDAIFKGEKPAKWYTSLEEAREDLGV
jgi:hypothetical protein